MKLMDEATLLKENKKLRTRIETLEKENRRLEILKRGLERRNQLAEGKIDYLNKMVYTNMRTIETLREDLEYARSEKPI